MCKMRIDMPFENHDQLRLWLLEHSVCFCLPGIGREIAKNLAKCGASVIAVGRDKNQLGIYQQTVINLCSWKWPCFFIESLKQEVPSIETIAVDLSNWNATKDALKEIGPVDLLVNNAGLAILEPLTEVTEEHIDR